MGEVVEGTALVGRERELARLREGLGRAATGHGTTIVVGGEAGIGKSRLIDAFAAWAVGTGATVLTGACLELGEADIPYAPVVEALRGLVRSVEPARLPAILGPARAELGRLLPELSRSAPVTGSSEPDRFAQSRLFEVVAGLLERLAATAPVVLVVEDLQWSDQSSRDLLAVLRRTLRRAAVLVIVSARTDEVEGSPRLLPFLAELERDDGVERIELAPFDRQESREYVGRLLAPHAGTGVVDRLYERSGGNPFFLEQLVEIVRERIDETALPPHLREVLQARTAALSDEARIVLRAASVGGRNIDDELLAGVVSLPEGDVATALREILGRGILIEAGLAEDDIGRAAGYAFRHALLRESVSRELLAGERRRLHAAFARALTERSEVGGVPVAPEELAYHWDGAGDWAPALAAFVAAGRSAERVYAFEAARRHFERALALWDRVPDPVREAGVDRPWLRLRAAEAAALTGAYGVAIEHARAAVADAQTPGHDPPASPGDVDAERVPVGLIGERLRWFLWEAGRHEAAEAAVTDALERIPDDEPSSARARALGQAAGIRLRTGDFRAAARLAEEAVAAAVDVGAAGEEALARGVLGWAQAVLGDVDGGIATFHRALAIAEALGGAEGIALGYTNLAGLLDRVGRTTESLEAARHGLEVADRLGVGRTYGAALLGDAAKALLNLGRWHEASAAIDEGLGREPVGAAAVWLLVNRGRLETGGGRFDAASRTLSEAEATDEELDGTEHRLSVLAALAELAAWQGRVDDLRVVADRAAATVRPGEPPDPSLAWVAALALRGEADEAERARARRDSAALAEAHRRTAAIMERLAAFEAAFASTGATPGPRERVLADLCRAEAGRGAGERTADVWLGIVEAWDRLGRPYAAAYARLRLAAALLAERGSRDEAAGALRDAWKVSAELGAEPLRGEVERLARQARLGLDRDDALEDGRAVASGGAVAHDPFGFTEREREVLQLVVGGWSNQQIADALFITRKTASVHVSNILGKLGVSGRVEAAGLAHRLGLAPDAPPPPGAGVDPSRVLR